MLAPAAASSLDKPNAIAAQNLLSSSRPATGGRPGEGNGALPERSERRRLHLVIVTPHEALRRPLDFYLAAAVGVMYEPAAMDGPPIMEGLLQRIEHEARMCCP